MKTAAALICFASLILVTTATAAPTVSPQDKKVAALERQVKALKADNKRLRSRNGRLQTALDGTKDALATVTADRDQIKADRDTTAASLKTVTAERDSLKTQLATAQSGTPGAVRSMGAVDVWNSILPAVAAVFSSNTFKTDYYSSGDYRSYTFTYCGFC